MKQVQKSEQHSNGINCGFKWFEQEAAFHEYVERKNIAVWTSK